MKLIDVIRAKDKLSDRETAKAKNIFMAFKEGKLPLPNDKSIKYVFDDKNFKPNFTAHTHSVDPYASSELSKYLQHSVTISLRKKNEGVYDSTLSTTLKPFKLFVVEADGTEKPLSKTDIFQLQLKYTQIKKIFEQFKIKLRW